MLSFELRISYCRYSKNGGMKAQEKEAFEPKYEDYKLKIIIEQIKSQE